MQVCTSPPTDNNASTLSLRFFGGQMPFLLPNQQRESTEGNIYRIKDRKFIIFLTPFSASILYSSLSGTDANATHCLASVKSRLVLPVWYRLT